jgi:ribonuclease-3
VPLLSRSKPSRRLEAARKTRLLEFAKRLRVTFRSLELMDCALTHSSARNESSGRATDNQRLEYLGDSVLSLVINEYLYSAHPDYAEGELARVKSALVSEASLAKVGAAIGIGPNLNMGRGERASGGESRPSNLADALEALIAAVYLDRGLEAARRFILRHFAERIRAIDDPTLARDPKSRLQEWIQREARSRPEYELVSESGPDHRREFETRVLVAGKELARGRGSSRKRSEQEAASRALEKLDKLEKKRAARSGK